MKDIRERFTSEDELDTEGEFRYVLLNFSQAFELFL